MNVRYGTRLPGLIVCKCIEQMQVQVNYKSSGLQMVVLGLNSVSLGLVHHSSKHPLLYFLHYEVGVGLVIHRARVKGCLLVPTEDEGKHVQASVCVLLQPPFVLVPSTDSLLASCFSQSHLTLNVLAHFYPSLKMLSHFLCLCTFPTEACMPSNTSVIFFLLKTESHVKTRYLFFPLLYSDVLRM